MNYQKLGKELMSMDELAVMDGSNVIMNNRTEQFHFFATPEEAKLIRDREKEIGILNESAYLRKMAIDGYLIQMDLSDVKEAARLLGITSSNMNQYAKKANETE